MTIGYFSVSLPSLKITTMTRIRNKVRYNLQAPIKPSDYWIGSDGVTGITKNFSGEGVIDLVSNYLGFDNEITGLISVGGITTGSNQVTLTNVRWRVDGEEFLIATHVQGINGAAPGFYRTDIIIGNADGALGVRSGISSQTNPTQPALGIDEVLVTVVNVYGSQITPEVPPLTDFKRKSEEAQNPFNAVGTISDLLWNSKNTYVWGGIQELKLVGLVTDEDTSQYMYDGRLFTLINKGTDRIQVLYAPGSEIPLYSGERAKVLYQNQSATYKYSAAAQRLELLATNLRDYRTFSTVTRLYKGFRQIGGIITGNTEDYDEVGDFFHGTDSEGKYYPCLRYRGGNATLLTNYSGIETYNLRPIPTDT